MEAIIIEVSALTLAVSFAAAFIAGYAARSFASYRRRRRWLANYGIDPTATRAKRF